MISDSGKREKERRRGQARRTNAKGGEVDEIRSDAEARLHLALSDILDYPNDDARSFFKTAGIMHILEGSPDRVWPAFRDHYTTDGAIDDARFATDFAMWPPIASRIVELQMQRRAAAS